MSWNVNFCNYRIHICQITPQTDAQIEHQITNNTARQMDEKKIIENLNRLVKKTGSTATKISICSLLYQLQESLVNEKLTHSLLTTYGDFGPHVSQNTLKKYLRIAEVCYLIDGKVYVKNLRDVEEFAERHRLVDPELIRNAISFACESHQMPFLAKVEEVLVGLSEKFSKTKIDSLKEYSERWLKGSGECIVLNDNAENKFLVTFNDDICQSIQQQNPSIAPHKFIQNFMALFVFLVETSGALSFPSTYKASIAMNCACYSDFELGNGEPVVSALDNKPHTEYSTKIIANLWRNVMSIFHSNTQGGTDLSMFISQSNEQLVDLHFKLVHHSRQNESAVTLARRFR